MSDGPATVGGVKIAAPRLRAQLESATPTDVDDEERLLDLELVDVDLSDLEAEHVEISGCRLTRSKLAGSELEKLILVDTELTQCDLANSRWADAALSRVAVSGARMIGFAGPGATFQHVTVRDTVLDFASFRFAKFIKTEFADCRLQNADFVSADLTGVLFRGCDLSGVEFSQVKAAKAQARAVLEKVAAACPVRRSIETEFEFHERIVPAVAELALSA